MVDELGHQPVPAPVHDAAPRPVLDQSETSIVGIHQSETSIVGIHQSQLTLTRLRAKSKLRSAENLRMRSTQKPEQHLNLVEFGFRFSSVMLTPTGTRDTPARNMGRTLYFVRTYTKVSFEIPSSDKFY